MRHQQRTKRFRHGKDANRMLLRKLSRNFFLKGSLTTTITKVKVLRPRVEHMVSLAKRKTEGGKNMLLRYTGDKLLVSLLTQQIAPVFQEKTGGFVRVVRIGSRSSDGSEIARLEWTLPVVIEKKAAVKKSVTVVTEEKPVKVSAKKSKAAPKSSKKV
ncbi:hypothetical protein A3G67_04850 [Candidatus Roizmanbacteria bacterium RIFCSPLOWO2_12_FULL_40_12]|uniref:50S ribosomal protein L17 n=1 Tax=Candidatus Roizmanbacteria bacterium RIFCSPLOWO2_01_FULL_40_42 TaxID=1802066 RepID=A0A1F7J4J2_9BACT|nr:MAG: hypothetical protein A2779_04300 [Candidatus Roizmanbacteria bacterium RIFCSPHIGHO2_01_FULL_40_98]OGK27298.1 MAG: hypothetical protein A3C31_04625 [Candidatus Roizmanbacteria bacterium RIFCSPHIGHO2_02_FULL_40_53]OGK30830.1 MAG: hypothetical protein A2W49_02415 [Candidatus Roizmanbacteria bacterium RIFCSPHIGHO2_12_41_18]OGK36403.1 MAG: hypothetical protein A3E69_02250 [Candidatus Roizmanbacteria bacterium RIFCSPHIGHO2_12_FULL_40_130]OGK50531.1 MAG: hypothetical protein A3B50_01980 [Candi